MAQASQLTLAQKAALVTGAGFWKTHAFPEAGIETAYLSDGPHGLRHQSEEGGSDNLGLSNSTPATAIPVEAAVASTWNPDIIRLLGRVLAYDAQRLGVDIVLGPGINIKRSPLGGRNFEYYSEDPYLSGVLGSAMVTSLEEHGIGASVKHYAANNQETQRLTISADVDERTLREIYLPAFEMIVRSAKPSTLMCSYNQVNGIPASEHHWLQTEVLRDEWGFDGYVVSDWGAVDDLPAAVAAGVDLTMPFAGQSAIQSVIDAVENGTLAEEVLDRACERIVTVHELLRANRKEVSGMDAEVAHEISRAAAAESIVMLKNEKKTLPLSDEGGRIAVIGEFARSPRYRGGGSSQVTPTKVETLLDVLPTVLSRDIAFAPGYLLDDADDTALGEEAVTLASGAEVTVLMLGLPDSYESEGFDREHMRLPKNQLTLLTQVADVARTLIVVLTNGSIIDMTEITPRADAILEAWIGGQASGAALADVLSGATEPGGRLAETIPHRLQDTPAYINWPGNNGHVTYGERMYVGYRYYDTKELDVAYPFGFGLGYTTFDRSAFLVEVPDLTAPHATVRLTIANTGSRRGSDVIQVYVQAPASQVDRPLRELRAFTKVTLDPGESQTVQLELHERAFAYWNTAWVVEPGEYLIEVGASSRDIYATQSITLELPSFTKELTTESSLSDWEEHPVAAALLREALADGGGMLGGALDDPELRQVLGDIPLRKFVVLSGQDPSLVTSLLAHLKETEQAQP